MRSLTGFIRCRLGLDIFNVLALSYETFHSRMLHWLWSADADHNAGDAFGRWRACWESLPLDRTVDDNVKIEGTSGRWRLSPPYAP